MIGRIVAVQATEKGEAMISQPSLTPTQNGEVEYSTPVLSQYEKCLRVLELAVQLLIERTSMGDYWAEGLQDAEDLLVALPLALDEFAFANRHLQNAAGYCQQEEFGAATFELRVLRGQLQQL